MATHFNFPASPIVGATYPISPPAGIPQYMWDGEKWVGVASGAGGGGSGGGASVTTSDTPPVSPKNGDLWWETDSGLMFVYWNDGTSSQWCVAMPGSGGGTSSGTGTSNNAEVINTGILIPYYLYPSLPYSNPDVQGLLDTMKSYRDVPVLVVVNAGSPGGPGTVLDVNWSTFIGMIQGAGGKILGYVDTANGTRPEADVKTEISLWLSLYPNPKVDGIFFDEMPYATGPGGAGDTTYVDLYKRYTDYCHGLGLNPVVANPGANQQPAWFATYTADVIVVNENSTWPTEADMEGNFVGGHAFYPPTRRAGLVYKQSTLDTGLLDTLRKNVQWVYVTNDDLPNPWDTLPPYLEQLFAAVSLSGGGGISEAPLDGITYGRQSANWTHVLMANNDIVDGGNF